MKQGISLEATANLVVQCKRQQHASTQPFHWCPCVCGQTSCQGAVAHLGGHAGMTDSGGVQS
jgi:hypothetical protein